MLHVHRAARPRELVGALADVLVEPLDDPFAPEVVAVPAHGVERWLGQQLSHELGRGAGDDGVCAGVVFARPRVLFDDVVAQVSPDHAAAVAAWRPEALSWRLLEVLDTLEDEEWGRLLRHHLHDPHGTGRRTATAQRLAQRFTALAAERPDLVRAWLAGADDVPPDLAWQPLLLRRLRERVGPSPAELLDDTCAALTAAPDRCALPRRVSLFGATRLDTARLQVLRALAGHRDVHLWVHHVSPALWDAVADAPPTPLRRQLRVPVDNPLLASLSRDVQELQVRLSAGEVATTTHGELPAPATLLGRLQASLASGTRPTDRAPVRADDRSVQVHSCHGRARQVEVLREVVLGLLADHPDLEPRDVLVMCPDVEVFAPLVTAVFAAEGHPVSRLRVTVADRSPRATNPLLALAADLLALAGSRATASQVLDLAGTAAVRQRFALCDDDLDRLRAWVVAAEVRWGLDAEHRAQWGIADLEQGTWAAGQDRLLAGVALDEAAGVVEGVLPLDGVESSDIAVVGRVAELVDRLRRAVAALSGAKAVGDWLTALEEGVLSLGDVPHDGAWQLAQLRRELAEVREHAGDGAVPLSRGDVVRVLEDRLRGRPTRTGFRTGALTVCTMTPMRSVPHRVVCLLGLDDGAFPRWGGADGDDLLAREPHVGERDVRSEDRQLFLDALMAAEQHLVITYAGRHVRTGAPLPPAVPVGELLDHLDELATSPDGDPVRERVVVEHPLQPFSPRCFTGDDLGTERPFSFDPAALSGAVALRGERRPAPALVPDRLPAPAEEGTVSVRSLAEALEHPAKALLRQRLGVWTATRDDEPDSALPLEPGSLASWQVGDRLLTGLLAGRPVEALRAAEEVRGSLPPGGTGTALLDDAVATAQDVASVAAPYRAQAGDSREVEVALPDGRTLTGRVRGVHGDRLVVVTYSKLAAKHRMRVWLDLLALAASDPGRAWSAVLVGRGSGGSCSTCTITAPDAATARQHLEDLVAVRDLALQVPLLLPQKASCTFAEKERDGSWAWKAAADAWETGLGARFDNEDRDADWVLVVGEHVRFGAVFDRPLPPDVVEPGRGHDRARTPFARLSLRIWSPLLDAESWS